MKLLLITFYKLKAMLADKTFFLAMVIIPLFITVATGYALRHEKLNVVPLAIVDEDNSDSSKILVDRLLRKEGLQISLTDSKKAFDMLEGQKVEAVFVIKQGFDDKIAQGNNEEVIDLAKSPSSFAVDYVKELVSGEVMRLTAASMAVEKVTGRYRQSNIPVDNRLIDDINKYYDSQWEPGPLMTVDYREIQGNVETEVKRVALPASTATSAGIILVFIMFFILFSSSWIIEERTNGTLKRLIAGPGALRHSFTGNIAALMTAGMLQIALFSLINRLAFGVNLFTGALSYILFGAYLLSVISISMLLSSLLKTPAQLQAGAPVFALLTGFAGGCFWNFVDSSKQIRQLAVMTPQGWTLEGINRLLINPGDTGAALTSLLVLLAISGVLLPLSFVIIKRQVVE